MIKKRRDSVIPKCNPGNKVCGQRCIPEDEACHIGEVKTVEAGKQALSSLDALMGKFSMDKIQEQLASTRGDKPSHIDLVAAFHHEIEGDENESKEDLFERAKKSLKDREGANFKYDPDSHSLAFEERHNIKAKRLEDDQPFDEYKEIRKVSSVVDKNAELSNVLEKGMDRPNKELTIEGSEKLEPYVKSKNPRLSLEYSHNLYNSSYGRNSARPDATIKDLKAELEAKAKEYGLKDYRIEEFQKGGYGGSGVSLIESHKFKGDPNETPEQTAKRIGVKSAVTGETKYALIRDVDRDEHSAKVIEIAKKKASDKFEEARKDNPKITIEKHFPQYIGLEDLPYSEEERARMSPAQIKEEIKNHAKKLAKGNRVTNFSFDKEGGALFSEVAKTTAKMAKDGTNFADYPEVSKIRPNIRPDEEGFMDKPAFVKRIRDK